jgi:hypothetical protein
MNADIDVLFHLTIPLDFLKKLKNYYYIPENKISTLKTGGFIYFVNKMITPKTIHYSGILLNITDTSFICSNYIYELSEIYRKYHVFYRPKITKLQSAIILLNSSVNSLGK